MARLLDLARKCAAGYATDADFAGMMMHDVLDIKSDPDLDRYAPIIDLVGVNRADSDDTGSRTVPYAMSTEAAVGNSGDVIPLSAWDLGDFEKRGRPFLYAHNLAQDLPPLGNMSKPKKGKTHAGVRALLGSATFSGEGLSAFNDLIFDLVDSGVMTNGSVGFSVRDARAAKSEREQEKLGLGKYGVIFTDVVLKEFSAVPVGMDPDATTQRSAALDSLEDRLVQLVDADIFDADLVQEFRVRTAGLTPRLRVAVPVLGLPQTTCSTDTSNGDLREPDGNPFVPVDFDADRVDELSDQVAELRAAIASVSAYIESLVEMVDATALDTANVRSRLDAQINAAARTARAERDDTVLDLADDEIVCDFEIVDGVPVITQNTLDIIEA